MCVESDDNMKFNVTFLKMHLLKIPSWLIILSVFDFNYLIQLELHNCAIELVFFLSSIVILQWISRNILAMRMNVNSAVFLFIPLILRAQSLSRQKGKFCLFL